jgi:hypothetical protein
MSLILVDNASLYSTEPSEDAPNLTFCSAGTTYKQCTTEDFYMVALQIVIPLNKL